MGRELSQKAVKQQLTNNKKPHLLEQARLGSNRQQDQCMKIAIRIMTGIGTPRKNSSNERMRFSLN
jgi:hypothetical protein